MVASASDADGVVTSVNFYANGTLVGTSTSAPYSFAWQNVAHGTYTITAKATDDDGLVTTSGGITINVQ
jgi:chitinase